MRQQLYFYVRSEDPAKVPRKVALNLVTNGGNCKTALTTTLSDFFRKVGLTERFTWDAEYWPVKGKRTPPEEDKEA
jgi:hypothetical protein